MPNPIPLDVIDIARPCPADWNAMAGDERVRFCGHCRLNVYNLSAMSRAAAETLIAEKEGELCARFYRRKDGTVITADCGGGWKLRAKRLGVLAGMACAAVASGLLAPLGFSRDSLASGQALDSLPPARFVERVILTLTGTPPPPPVVVGLIAAPPMGRIAPRQLAVTTADAETAEKDEPRTE